MSKTSSGGNIDASKRSRKAEAAESVSIGKVHSISQ